MLQVTTPIKQKTGFVRMSGLVEDVQARYPDKYVPGEDLSDEAIETSLRDGLSG